jgi:muconolactone delta-isomerase
LSRSNPTEDDMRFIAIAHRSEKHKPEDFAPHLAAESAHAIKLFAQEKVREIFSRSDGKGAVLVVEAADEAEAEKILSELPLAKLGMLTFDIYGLKPYRGFVANVK